MNTGERISYELDRLEMTQRQLADITNINKSVINRIVLGSRPARDDELLSIANALNVSVDYLIGNTKMPKPYYYLTNKDEKDIAKTLEKMIENLDGLRYSKEEAEYSDETRELLIGALEQAARIAKMEAKRKFTPKKYRGGED